MLATRAIANTRPVSDSTNPASKHLAITKEQSSERFVQLARLARGPLKRSAPMQRMFAIAAIAAVTLIAPQIVLAQGSQPDQGYGSIREQVKNGLEKAGFSNIQIAPEAFLVRAIGPNGNPVTLMVNADAFRAASNDDNRPNLELQQRRTPSNSAEMRDGNPNTPGRPNGMMAELKAECSPTSNSHELPTGCDLANAR